MPLHLHAKTSALRHIERLHWTPSASFLLQRFIDHPCSPTKSPTATLCNAILSPPLLPPIAAPQSSRPSLQIRTECVGRNIKSTLPDTFCGLSYSHTWKMRFQTTCSSSQMVPYIMRITQRQLQSSFLLSDTSEKGAFYSKPLP